MIRLIPLRFRLFLLIGVGVALAARVGEQKSTISSAAAPWHRGIQRYRLGN
jgi:hypothetical protein